jgi:hypothetical protein
MTHSFKVGDIALGLERDSNAALGYVLRKCKILEICHNIHERYVVIYEWGEGFKGNCVAELTNGASGRGIILHLFSTNEILINFLKDSKKAELFDAKMELKHYQAKIKRINSFDVDKEVNDLLSTV